MAQCSLKSCWWYYGVYPALFGVLLLSKKLRAKLQSCQASLQLSHTGVSLYIVFLPEMIYVNLVKLFIPVTIQRTWFSKGENSHLEF